MTVVTKVPVPVTVAVHWLVCPDCTAVGVHERVTAVMVPVLLLLPPPHAQMPRSSEQETMKTRKRKPSPRRAYEISVEAANDYLNDK